MASTKGTNTQSNMSSSRPGDTENPKEILVNIFIDKDPDPDGIIPYEPTIMVYTGLPDDVITRCPASLEAFKQLWEIDIDEDPFEDKKRAVDQVIRDTNTKLSMDDTTSVEKWRRVPECPLHTLRRVDLDSYHDVGEAGRGAGRR
jgi:hypothetical protein